MNINPKQKYYKENSLIICENCYIKSQNTVKASFELNNQIDKNDSHSAFSGSPEHSNKKDKTNSNSIVVNQNDDAEKNENEENEDLVNQTASFCNSIKLFRFTPKL